MAMPKQPHRSMTIVLTTIIVAALASIPVLLIACASIVSGRRDGE